MSNNTYTLDQLSINSGSISNSLIVNATNLSNTLVVSDTSDDNDDNDGNTEDDPAEVTMDQIFNLQVTKSVNTIDNDGDGIIGVGDQAEYTIIVSNTGNIDLVSLQLSDTLTDADGTALNFDSPITMTDSYTLEDNRSSGNSISYSSYFEDLSGTFDSFASSDNSNGNRYNYAYFEDDNDNSYFDDAVWWGSRYSLIEVWTMSTL